MVAFAPTSPQGLKRIPEALAGIPVETAAAVPPVRAPLAAGVEPARAAAGRALPRPGRRPPLLRLDVPAAARPGSARRWCTTSCRCGSPEWVQGRTKRMHGAKYRERRPHLRRRLRQLGVHEGRGGRAARGPAGAGRRRLPGRRGAVLAGGRGAPTSAGPTCSRSRRSSRARTWRRCSPRRFRRDTRWRSSGRPAGGRSRALDRPDVIRLGYVGDDELARLYRGAAVVRLPVPLRGLRDPGRRGDGERRPRRRLRAPLARRGRRRGGARAPTPRARRRSAPRSRRRCAAATSSCPPASPTPPGSAGPRPAARCSTRSPRYSNGDEGRPRRLAARPDAGGHGALHPRAPGPQRVRAARLRRRPARRDGREGRVVVPGRAAARGEQALDVLHCPTFRGPFRARRSRGSNRPRPRRPAPPGDVQPVDAALQPPCRSQGGAGGEARDRRLRVHARRDGRAARRAGGPDPGDPERGRRAVRARTARPPSGDYVLAVGTLEPRKNLAAAQQAARRLGVELRVVGARGWGGVEVDGWLGPGVRRRARRALPRRALPRLPVALRGLRHPGAGGDGLRDAGGDERGRRDRGGRRGRGRARRPARPGLDRRRDRAGGRAAATSSSRAGSSGRATSRGSGSPRRRGAVYEEAVA